MEAKKRKISVDTFWGYLFLLPWVAAFLVLQLYPFVLALKTSFLRLNYLNMENTAFEGLGNFTAAITDPLFWKSLLNVIFNQVIFIPLVIFTGLMVAVLLFELGPKAGFFRVIYFIPFITSITVAMMLYDYLSGPTGPVQSLLIHLGLMDVPLFWKSGSRWLPMPMIALFSVWKWFAVHMIILLSGLAGMNPEIEEAAMIDGAGWWKRLFCMKIPHLKPQFVFLLTMSIINGLQMFNEVFVLYGDNVDGGPFKAGLTPVLYLYREGFTYMRMGYASSVGILLAIFIFVLTAVQLKTSDKQKEKG